MTKLTTELSKVLEIASRSSEEAFIIQELFPELVVKTFNTYNIGDKFVNTIYPHYTEYILAQIASNVVTLINLHTGDRHTEGIIAHNSNAITKEEFAKLCPGLSLVKI